MRVILTLIVGLVLNVAVAAGQGKQEKKTLVAVKGLDISAGVGEELGRLLTDLLADALYKTGRYHVVSRKDTKAIEEELEFQQCDDVQCLADFGKEIKKKLPVEKVVGGTIGRLDKEYVVTLRLVDIGTESMDRSCRQQWSGGMDQAPENLDRAAMELAGLKTAEMIAREEAEKAAREEAERKAAAAEAIRRGGRVPPGCRRKEGSEAEPYTGSGWAKEVIHEKSGVELVYVPGGEFTMGSPAGEEGRIDREGPQRKVTIRGFYLGKVEVTQEQYEREMGKNPSYFKGSQRPVEQVSWHDAKGYCERVGMRLPSEAEWEYGCRAGTQTRFCCGDEENKLGEYAWYWENSGIKTHVVGQKRPNAWGLYDMHGNVWEWCEDVWHESYAGAPSDGRAWMEGGDSSKRVLRGGSWSANGTTGSYRGQSYRSAYRRGNSPASRRAITFGGLGFRVALGLPES